MKKVLLIDSGSGGVNILKECVKVCPHCDFLLFCDDENLPYGSKTKEKLIEITIKNLNDIRSFFKFDIVIFACNTLTSTCIETCRRKFDDVEFVGVEPAVALAQKEFDDEKIVVIATESTIKHNKLLQNTKIQLKTIENLAQLIDENLGALESLKPMLKEEFEGQNMDALVLGCTHYFAIRDILQEFLPNVKIFDSANGVARRLKSLVDDQDVCVNVQIITTKRTEFLPMLWWHYFKN